MDTFTKIKTCLLFSGGIDSTCILYWRRPSLALYIDYGHICSLSERKAAKQICDTLKIPLKCLEIDCNKLGTGILSGDVSVNLNSLSSEFWPFRNQLLITLASMFSFKNKIQTILIGSVKKDEYKDGTKQFIRKINNLTLYQEGEIKIQAPAINMTTESLIRKTHIPAPLLYWTHSCNYSNIPCGKCLSCKKQQYIFAKLEGRYNGCRAIL